MALRPGSRTPACFSDTNGNIVPRLVLTYKASKHATNCMSYHVVYATHKAVLKDSDATLHSVTTTLLCTRHSYNTLVVCVAP